jgi:hypothetical protein
MTKRKYHSSKINPKIIFSDLECLNTVSHMENGEMQEHNFVEEIISSLDPSLVPLTYVDLAFVVGLDGVERTIEGKELYELLNHPAREEAAMSIQIILDRKKLKKDIADAIDTFWTEVLEHGTADKPK